MNDYDTVTPGPWKWEFIGTAGNYFLVGNDGKGPICHEGPNSADGKLMAAAPDLVAEVTALKAQVEVMREALETARLFLEYEDHEGGPTHKAVCAALVGSPPAWDDPASIADFFAGPESTGKDPYEAFGEWAAEHGYNVEDETQLAAAIEAYGGENASV